MMSLTINFVHVHTKIAIEMYDKKVAMHSMSLGHEHCVN